MPRDQAGKPGRHRQAGRCGESSRPARLPSQLQFRHLAISASPELPSNAPIIPSSRFANLSNTERWWLEYGQRPARRRVNSLPPTIGKSLRNQLRRKPPRYPFWSGVRKTVASFRASSQWVNAKANGLYQASVDVIDQHWTSAPLIRKPSASARYPSCT